MPVTVKERPSGRGLSGDSAKREYVIKGVTGGDEEARSALLAAVGTEAPTQVNSWPLDAASATVEEIATDIYYGTLFWRNNTGSTPQVSGDITATFDTTGATIHLTQAYETVSSTAASGTAPDHKGAIGVTADGTVEGVDVVGNRYGFTRRKVVASADMTTSYKRDLFELTGRTNNASWSTEGETFNEGEALFLGAVGQRRADGDWEIELYFEGLPNETGIDVGGVITVPAKKGHEYLWVEYEPTKDATANATAIRPKAAHVVKVYKTGNFALLGV